MTNTERGVFITCPKCQANVRLLAHGFVAPHDSTEDRQCNFKRTAHSGMRPVSARLTEAQRSELDRKKADYKAAERAKRDRQSQQLAQNKRREVCGKCNKQVQAVSLGLAAHLSPSGKRWCQGGVPPTARQQQARYMGKSVRTVPGGLPGLGKR